MKKRIQTVFNITLIVLFLLGIWAPLLGMPFKLGLSDDFSELEKRDRMPFPSLSKNVKDPINTFLRGLDAWFSDRFGFRDALVHLHSWFSYYVLHTSPTPKVILGKDGWLFYAGDPINKDGEPITDYRGAAPFDLLKLERLRWMFEDQYDWLKDQGIEYMLVLVPAKAPIYEEYLPDYVDRVSDQTTREQVVDYLKQHTTVPVLDLTTALIDAKSHRLTYDKTDTHWNDYGAFIGCVEIITALSNRYPVLIPPSEEEFRFEESLFTGRDLAEMLSLHRDIMEPLVQMVPLTPRKSNPEGLGDEHGDVTASTGIKEYPTAVVYRDSFSNRLIPFLSEYFEAVRYKWARTGTRMEGIDKIKPDVVLQIMTDRALRLNLQYSPMMRNYELHKRFKESTDTLVNANAAIGFETLRPDENTHVKRNADYLLLQDDRGTPTIHLPDLGINSTNTLPILRLDIDAPYATLLTMSWPTRKDRDGEQGSRELQEHLRKGRSIIFMPLMDPYMSGAPTLQLGTAPGDYKLYSVEMKGYPR